MRLNARFARERSGSVAVWFALATIPLMVLAGAAIDYTQATMARASLLALTDRAALTAAAAQVATDQDRAARAQAFFPSSDYPATVAVNGDTVTVTAARHRKPAMLGIMGVTDIPIASRSVAERTYKGPPVCIMALNATASGAITFAGNSTFVADGCAIYSNSSSGSAIQAGGSATARAGGFCAVGGVSASGSTLTPTAETGCDRLPDPFRNLPAAGTPSPTYNNVTVQPNTTQALSPGTYRNGLTIKGTATLSPGLYVIQGSLTISSQANVTSGGSGVTFYLTGQQAGFSISGGGIVDLTAMTTGPYAGLLIVQDPTANTGNDNKLNGDSNTKLTGGIYTPTQTLTLAGSGNFGQSSPSMPVIVDQIRITGNATARLDATANMAAALPLTRGGARLTQ